jgi:predicted SAM-dependent methyltransferase
VAEFLPYGIVRRVAARRAERRRAALAIERERALRPVVSVAQGEQALVRLNMGCGNHREPGWINADADSPADLKVILRDAEPLPFSNASFDVVFSEHFLEHLSFVDGCHFLRESHRVLRKGGVFRVSCPDLNVIAGMLNASENSWQALARVYESIGDFPEGALNMPEHVVNWAFYGHGHKHLWSFQQLEYHLDQVGFADIHRMSFGVSNFDGAAIERRIPEAFYSLIVEARKR